MPIETTTSLRRAIEAANQGVPHLRDAFARTVVRSYAVKRASATGEELDSVECDATAIAVKMGCFRDQSSRVES